MIQIVTRTRHNGRVERDWVIAGLLPPASTVAENAENGRYILNNLKSAEKNW